MQHSKQDILNTPTTKIAIHTILWLLILQLIFDLSGVYLSFKEFYFEGDTRVDEAFFIIPLIIGLFYWNSQILIPKYLNRKSWWKYLLGLIISLFLFLGIGYLCYNWVEQKGYFFEIDLIGFLEFLFLFNLIVIGISTSVALSKIAFQNAAQKRKAEEKQKEAELKYLTAQVNPHFLFNTLNTVYALANEENAHKTTDAILKLSEIMRYPIKEGAKPKVALSKEIKLLDNYLALQKLRLGNDYPIHFEKGEYSESIEIAPLLFIPFVENAIKYGVSSVHKYPISIAVFISPEYLIFKIENTIHKKTDSNSSKLGIENVKRRLKLLYPESHELDISKKENLFLVKLKLFF